MPPNSPTPSLSPEVQPDYSFIYHQPKKRLNLPFNFNSSSLLTRIIVVVVGFVLLIVIYSIIKGILSAPPINSLDFTYLIENQQQILHILNTDVTNNNSGLLTQAQQDFASTASVAVQSAQNATITYMEHYGIKVNTSKLSTYASSSIDQELANAQTANDFSQTFSTIISTQLSNYQQALSTTYKATSLSGGRAMLSDEYAQNKLLITALNSPSS